MNQVTREVWHDSVKSVWTDLRRLCAESVITELEASMWSWQDETVEMVIALIEGE